MISPGADGVYIDVHVRPRARRTGVRGVHNQRLKIAVSEPPENGRANSATVEAIAALLGVRPGDVSLVSGTRSREKRVFVSGLDVEGATRMVMAAVRAAE
ncbi:MAG TPA: DUF167 domain-containing protein [Acidimicrobiia bacterium]|nr:DUF167 domain-containing protein [Acidimicrobiia bacterium]